MTLSVELGGDTGLVFRRRFESPPERVLAAHIDASLVREWMTGPEGWSMPVCEIDARPGGEAHYTWTNGDESFSMRSVFEVVEPPRLIVSREFWDEPSGMPRNWLETIFERDGKGTRMTIRVVYDTTEAREEALESGMTEGMETSYSRIDAVA